MHGVRRAEQRDTEHSVSENSTFEQWSRTVILSASVAQKHARTVILSASVAQKHARTVILSAYACICTSFLECSRVLEREAPREAQSSESARECQRPEQKSLYIYIFSYVLVRVLSS